MIPLIVTLHVICCLILILVILLQSGKGADLSGAFGGGGSQTTFGPRAQATILGRVTTGAAVLFMITSLSLALFMNKGMTGSSSVMEKAATKGTTTKPATKPLQPPKTPSPTNPVSAKPSGKASSIQATDPSGKTISIPVNVQTMPANAQGKPISQPTRPTTNTKPAGDKK